MKYRRLELRPHPTYCAIPTNPDGHCHQAVRPPNFQSIIHTDAYRTEWSTAGLDFISFFFRFGDTA